MSLGDPLSRVRPTVSESPIKRTIIPAVFLLLIALGLWGFAHAQIEDSRRSLVKRRLATAVEILRAPATDALHSTESRDAFLQDLRDWSTVTDLRLTLIQNDGSVLADTEVATGMPNLADRPEVQ